MRDDIYNPTTNPFPTKYLGQSSKIYAIQRVSDVLKAEFGVMPPLVLCKEVAEGLYIRSLTDARQGVRDAITKALESGVPRDDLYPIVDEFK